ncbi:MAG: hypothetical protein JWN17_2498, partial [Frankiales bacterium]|nr:hypothetical protein [Frankiales bacterium]
MVPAVPFAVLGVTALLAAASWTAVAACVVALRGVRLPSVLTGAGCLLLTAVEVVTALRFGESASDRLVLLRGTGALLLLAGVSLGAL